MRKVVGKFFKYVVAFIISLLVFNACLFLTCSFDSKLIKTHVQESSKILSKQGKFYQVSKFFNIINNNYTDAIIINEAYSIDNKHPFESYMRARRNYKKGLTTKEEREKTGEVLTINYNEDSKQEMYIHNSVKELDHFLSGKVHHSINYGRYWHGYLLIYRPLLLLFNIQQIRLLSFIVLTCLFGYFIYLLNKRFSKRIAFIFGISLLCSGYFSATYSLESTPIFLAMIISAIVFLKRIDKIKHVELYIFIVGCVANFVNFLTVPLITLGMLCSLYLLKMVEEQTDWKKCIWFLIRCSILWLIGYAGTWLAKWLLYDITINDGKSMVKIGFIQSFYRTQRVNEVVGYDKDYVDTILNIIGQSSLYVLLTTFVLLALNKFKAFTSEYGKGSIALFILSAYPIIWYVVLANHTVLHYFFTYRHSLVYMLAMLLFINNLLFGEAREKDNIE